MSLISHMHKLQTNPNDEWYTLYENVDVEMRSHLLWNPNIFRDKIIYFPCDDVEKSNFPKWFIDNSDRCEYARLICSCYNNKSNMFGIMSGDLWEVDRNGNVKHKVLCGSGDFRSNELSQYWRQADLIITNPPFSLFKDFMEFIVKYQKSYIVVGTIMKYSYAIMRNGVISHKIGGGYSSIDKFLRPDGTIEKLMDGIFITNLSVHRSSYIYSKIPQEEYMWIDNSKIVYCKSLSDIPKGCKYEMFLPLNLFAKYDYSDIDVLYQYNNTKKLTVNGKGVFAGYIGKFR